MEESNKQPTTTYAHPQTNDVGVTEIESPRGWKYKSLKLGPIAFPWYASPESQLIMVSFICFLCPGKAARPNCIVQ